MLQCYKKISTFIRTLFNFLTFSQNLTKSAMYNIFYSCLILLIICTKICVAFSMFFDKIREYTKFIYNAICILLM